MHFLFKMGWNTIHAKMLKHSQTLSQKDGTWKFNGIFRAGVPMHISILGSNSRATLTNLTTTFVLNKFMESIAKVLPHIPIFGALDSPGPIPPEVRNRMVWNGFQTGKKLFRTGMGFFTRFRTNNGSRFFEWIGFLRPFLNKRWATTFWSQTNK